MREISFDIEPNEINKLESKDLGDVKIKVKLSTFDLPKKVHSKINEDSGFLEIDFDYSDIKEKLNLEKYQSHGIALIIGVKTKRLYGIRLDCSHNLDNLGKDLCFQLQLEQTEDILDDLPKSRSKFRSQSLQAIKNLIHQYRNDLIPPSMATS